MVVEETSTLAVVEIGIYVPARPRKNDFLQGHLEEEEVDDDDGEHQARVVGDDRDALCRQVGQMGVWLPHGYGDVEQKGELSGRGTPWLWILVR